MSDAEKKATLHYPGGTAEFPILDSVDGASSIDLSTLTKQTGYTGLDYGFVNTASTKSAITYIDGANGVLRYRGYAIEDVAANANFLEVAWLLIYGELPTADELATFGVALKAPPLPFIPEAAHGTPVVMIATCFTGDLAASNPAR